MHNCCRCNVIGHWHSVDVLLQKYFYAWGYRYRGTKVHTGKCNLPMTFWGQPLCNTLYSCSCIQIEVHTIPGIQKAHKSCLTAWWSPTLRCYVPLCRACPLARLHASQLQAWPHVAPLSQKWAPLLDNVSYSHAWPLSALLAPFAGIWRKLSVWDWAIFLSNMSDSVHAEHGLLLLCIVAIHVICALIGPLSLEHLPSWQSQGDRQKTSWSVPECRSHMRRHMVCDIYV